MLVVKGWLNGFSDALTKSKTPEERRSLRSKTFLGIAKAMAKQWSKIKE